MNENQNLPLATPDFGSIKESLKTFLKSQSQLKDYDFEGSTMSVLLDTLSYNSHMMAFYLNMIGNESFLRTAIRRNSVVSNAADLGYSPKSAIAARADLQLEYTPNGVVTNPSLQIPKGTIFAANAGPDLFLFTTIDSHIANYNFSIGKFVIDSMPVYEGKLLTHTYTVVAPGASQVADSVEDVHIKGISLPNLNVDASTMSVYVDAGSGFIKYKEYDNSLSINSTSRIYFVGESEEELTTIRFGDGNLGIRLQIGSKIRIEYLVTGGPVANNIAKFVATSQVGDTTISHIGIKAASYGGADRESIDSIKFNAIRSFEAAGRGVTESDYVYLTKQIYPAAKSIISWGGQNNDPPQFGKVFICILPTSGSAVPDEAKESIITHLAKTGVITISPHIVDPEFIYVGVTTEVKYIPTESTLVGGALENKVSDNIFAYNDRNISSFDSSLRFSKLIAAIDKTDSGIISNTTSLKLSSRFYFAPEEKSSSTLRFANALKTNSISSSLFKYNGFENCSFSAVGTKLIIITSSKNGTLTLVSDAGEVDYDTGVITINPLAITSVASGYYDPIRLDPFVVVSGIPVELNVMAKLNQIITIDSVKVKSSAV